jgi:hypothetical protein
MGRIVLENDKHQGGKGDHPQETVSILGTGRHIRRPVSRVNESNSDQKSGSEISKQFEKGGFRLRAAHKFPGQAPLGIFDLLCLLRISKFYHAVCSENYFTDFLTT